jgi:hypothetical protein
MLQKLAHGLRYHDLRVTLALGQPPNQPRLNGEEPGSSSQAANKVGF